MKEDAQPNREPLRFSLEPCILGVSGCLQELEVLTKMDY
jgi:hypothetical protein